MLSFAEPWVLLLLSVAAAAGWWAARRRRPALRYSDLCLVENLPAGRSRRATWGPPLLRGSAVGLLLLAAANPRLPDLRTPIPVDGIAIVLALDVSGSMAEKFGGPDDPDPTTRLDAAKNAFRLFVAGGDGDGIAFSGRPSDQLGLVTFANVVWPECPLTLEHDALIAVLEQQKVKEGTEAGTNIGDAIAEAVIRLVGSSARKKVLVLLSDGEQTREGNGVNSPLKPRQAAQLAANLKMRIYAIDAGGVLPPRATQKQIDDRREGQQSLASVAEMTEGRYFAANSAAELQQVCAEIDRLEREPVPGPRYRRYREYGGAFAAVGLAVLIALGILDRTAWRRLPG